MDLNDLPKVYCTVCGLEAKVTGPSQVTCSNNHVVAIWHIVNVEPKVEPKTETWRDRKPLL